MYEIKVQYGQGFEKNKNWFVPVEEFTNVKLEKFKDQVVSVIGAVFPKEEAKIMYRDNENDSAFHLPILILNTLYDVLISSK